MATLSENNSGSDNNLNLDKMCRTCLSKEVNLHSIFDVCLETTTLDYIITTITGIELKDGDGLPQTVCSECREKATIAFVFKKKSQESDTLLRAMCANTNCREDEDTFSIKIENLPGVKTEVANNDDEEDSYESAGFQFENSIEDTLQEFSNTIAKNDLSSQDLQCKLCHQVLNSEKAFKDHISRCIKVEYHEDYSTYCPLCGICFSDAHLLTKHMWSEHADLMGPKKRGRPKKMLTSAILSRLLQNGFQVKTVKAPTHNCSICKDNFNNKQDLREHMKEHRGMKVYCCLLCKNMYLKKLNCERHMCSEEKEENKSDEKHNKDIDDENLNNVKAMNSIDFLTEMSLQGILDINEDMDDANIPQVCSICSALYVSIEDLLNHTDNEHPDVSQRCNICLKVFASVRTAARHRKLCKEIERKYKCTTCGLKFAYEVSLNKHILRFHEGERVSVKFIDSKEKLAEKKFPCSACNRSFYRQDLLDKHTKIHMPNAKKYECDICKKTFFRADSLRTHLLVHEPNREKALASNTCLCLYCGRSFTNSSNLIVHMRRHTGEKPYKCDFCDKGFPRSSDLQCHRRSHTGERPCICSICGKAFSRSNKLSRHMRVHTGLRPYKCTYCDKAFSQSNDLKLHIRRHTGDKPYVCEICGDRFIQGTALQNHRRAHGHFPVTMTDVHLSVQNLIDTKPQLLEQDEKKAI